MLQKNNFEQKKLNVMHRFKSANLAIFQFWQNVTFEPLPEIQNFFAKTNLLKHYKNGRMDLCRKKYKIRRFSEKPSQELKFFVVLGSYESLQGLER